MQGSSNVTHGCINLSTDNAKAYYDTALYGDPVEVTGTPVKLAARDGDIWDWTLSWDQWKALSALCSRGPDRVAGGPGRVRAGHEHP